MTMNGRADVIAYLRTLADSKDGVEHRQWLFRAALMLDRDVSVTFVDRRPAPIQERHGDQRT